MNVEDELWKLERERTLWGTRLEVTRDVAEEWEKTGGLVSGSEGAILLERDIDQALADRIAKAERELAELERQIISGNRRLLAELVADRERLKGLSST